MTTASRIERISNRLARIGVHGFHGASVMALATMVYGGRTGLAGDVFVSFARDYGTNLAVISAALVFLVSLWGFMVALFILIVGIVTVAQSIRTMRAKSGMTNQESQRNLNTATIVLWARQLDDVTIANIGDRSIDALDGGRDTVVMYRSSPRPSTLTVVGDVVTMEVELTVQYAEGPSVTVNTLLTGNISGDSPGLTNLSRIDRTAG